MAGRRRWSGASPAVRPELKIGSRCRSEDGWWRSSDPWPRDEHCESVAAGAAGQTDPVLLVGESRRRSDELVLMYRNLKAAGLGGFPDGGVADNFSYWASSQQTADMASHVDFADLGRQHSDDKDFPRRVRAVRAI